MSDFPTPNGPPAREYRIAAEFRRCCWYVIAGVVLVTVVAYWVAGAGQRRDPAGVVAACGVAAVTVAAMIVALRWRLRVDEFGIARRGLFGWDFWSWNDIASGQLRKLHPYTLFDPRRSWRRRGHWMVSRAWVQWSQAEKGDPK